MQVILETERLFLRKMTMEDLNEITHVSVIYREDMASASERSQ
jgi:hypothetical protein